MIAAPAAARFPRLHRLVMRFRHPIAYLFVGGTAGLIHLAVGYALIRFGGVDPAWASLVGFVAANPFSYLGHKFITFMVPGRNVFEAMRFVIGAVLGLALASALPYVLIDGLGVPRFAALFIAVIAIPVVNYLAMRFWVFARKRQV